MRSTRRTISSTAVIAIDGPGGSGKGTVASRLAAELGWRLLDSGALYRVVGLIALRRGIDFDDGESLAAAARNADIAFRDGVGAMPGAPIRVVVDGVDETDAIRRAEIEQPASRVAAVPALREALFTMQRAFRRPPGLVADGRDMGTVVFPDARLKIYLTASVDARARRRFEQLKEREASGSLRAPFGSDREDAAGSAAAAALAAIRASTEARDERDRTRSVSPLLPAPDAVTIDSTEMSIDDVMAAVMALVQERGLTAEGRRANDLDD